MLGKLYVTYSSSTDEQSLYVDLEFNDSTDFSIIIERLKASVKKETEAIYRKKQIREEIKNNKKELSFEQKCVLVLYLCKFTEDTQDNRVMFCKIYNVEITESSHATKLAYLTKESQSTIFDIVCSIRDKNAIDTFISFCCSFSAFLTNQQDLKEFSSILSEWGYNEVEIKIIVNDAIHKIVIPDGINDLPETPFPLSVAEQQKVMWAYLTGKLYKEYPFEKDTIDYSQKYSLFATLVSLCHPLYVFEREDIIDIVANYAVYLNLDQQDVENSFIYQTIVDRDRHLETIKSIKDDPSLMCFIAVCKNIIDISGNFVNMNPFFLKLLMNIGYTIDECVLIDRGEYIHKYDQNQSNNKDADSLFIYSWALKSFMQGRDNGMKIKFVVNRETGQGFRICVLEDDRDFFIPLILPTSLGHLTPAELLEKKESLRVGVTTYGDFCLYDKTLTESEMRDLGI